MADVLGALAAHANAVVRLRAECEQDADGIVTVVAAGGVAGRVLAARARELFTAAVGIRARPCRAQ